ncbi:uncharacterized protein LOC110346221 [Heterocephalus glaber]|uniref:Uncharacterized protein LOC110346221 n=1 Tax=Heterocephalus glaber TaxID=10181 RepID=A0AAX6S3G6_HETGA|nr:uncharacterized protein LOC110346221 [Heterocephalus glaber]
MTWRDIYTILSTTLSPEERQRVWRAAQAAADDFHARDPTKLVGIQAVPDTQPDWTYQDGDPGRDLRDYMIVCLGEGLKRISQKTVNFDKIREITQGPQENPAQFLSKLANALQKYAKIDPTSQAGTIVINTHFISQSAPDIRRKLKRVEEGPQATQTELLNVAFKVFSHREEQAKQQKVANYQMLAAAQQVSRCGDVSVRAHRPGDGGLVVRRVICSPHGHHSQ